MRNRRASTDLAGTRLAELGAVLGFCRFVSLGIYMQKKNNYYISLNIKVNVTELILIKGVENEINDRICCSIRSHPKSHISILVLFIGTHQGG